MGIHHVIIDGTIGLIMASLFLIGWWLGPQVQPASFFRHRQRGARPTRAVINWVWQRVTMEQTRRDAATMQMGATQLFLIIGILGFGGGLILLIMGIPWYILLAGIIAAGLFIPNLIIRRRFARWQRQLVAGLPGFLHHLQILLDLGQPLIVAIQRSRSRLSGPLGTALDRVIFDMQRGQTVSQAFGTMALRTRRMETLVLAAILSTTAGRRLSGQSLEPLMVMLNSVQIREEERVTGNIDQVISAVPIMAVFGAMIMGLYLMMAQALSGLHGLQL